MNEIINGVKEDVAQWRRKEQSMREIDPASLNDPQFLREKLEFFDRIAGKYKYSGNPDERLAMTYVNKVRKDITDAQLGRWAKFIRWIGIGAREDKISGEHYNLRDENVRKIGEQLKDLKLGFVNNQVQEKMVQGLKQFDIPVSYYVNKGERMDINLHYTRQQDGSYNLDSYRASLKNEHENRIRDLVIKPINGKLFDSFQAYNLLDGRSVMLNHHIKMPDEVITDQVWYKLDFNDKNPTGDFKIKEFHSNYGYDLKSSLIQIESKQHVDPEELSRLAGILESGGSVSLDLPRDGHYKTIVLEADPQNRDFKFYIDQGGQALLVSRNEALFDNHQSRDVAAGHNMPGVEESRIEVANDKILEKQPMLDGPMIPADHIWEKDRNITEPDMLREKLIELGFEGSKDEKKLSEVTERVRGGERVEVSLKTEDNNSIQMFVETDSSKTQLNYFIHPRSFSYEQRQAQSQQEVKKDDYKLQSEGRAPVLLEKTEQPIPERHSQGEKRTTHNRINLDTERLAAIAEKRKSKRLNH